MTDEEQKQYFYDMFEEYGELLLSKLWDKLQRIHRSNSINIMREWKEEFDKIKYPRESK